MKKFLLLILAISLCVSVIGCFGPRRSKRLKAPSYDPQAIAAAAIKQYDLNGDGQISGDELDKAPSIKFAFPNMPAVTSTEIANRVRIWKESRLGLQIASAKFVKDGKPVDGAEVTVSSEDFMGGNKIQFTDTTNLTGVVTLTAPNEDNLPGIQCGFYKIDVKYKGKTYNFGIEIGENSGGDAPTFELKD